MKVIELTLAVALRQMLDDSGFHQDELARRADIAKGSITNYTKGRTVPKWSTVRRWAETCGYEPDDPLLHDLWEKAKGIDEGLNIGSSQEAVAA